MEILPTRNIFSFSTENRSGYFSSGCELGLCRFNLKSGSAYLKSWLCFIAFNRFTSLYAARDKLSIIKPRNSPITIFLASKIRENYLQLSVSKAICANKFAP